MDLNSVEEMVIVKNDVQVLLVAPEPLRVLEMSIATFLTPFRRGRPVQFSRRARAQE